MPGEPMYIVLANIRRYERLLAAPDTPSEKRAVLVRLLSETRREIDADAEKKASSYC
jgi:hypothetical protein